MPPSPPTTPPTGPINPPTGPLPPSPPLPPPRSCAEAVPLISAAAANAVRIGRLDIAAPFSYALRKKRRMAAVSSTWSTMPSSPSFDSELAAVWPRLRRFAHALARNPEDADDLAQMAVEKAFKSFGQFQAGTRFDSWLFRICRTSWIDTVRSRGRRAAHEAPAEMAEAVGYDPLPATEAALDLAKARAAMQRLPEEQREVV